jgi:hypothetical protein
MAEKLTETYLITKMIGDDSKNRVSVYVEISAGDEITVRNDRNNPQFVFTKSDPNLVKAMALALHEAAELVETRKESAA